MPSPITLRVDLEEEYMGNSFLRRGGVPRHAVMLLLAITAAGTIGLASAPPAGAYVTINSDCILRIWAPYNDGFGDLVSSGETDCGTHFRWTTFRECMDVHNANGNWYTVGDSCTPAVFTENNAIYAEFFYAGSDNGLYSGHVYRTYDQGAAYTGTGQTGIGSPDGYNEQHSQSYTCCS